MPARAAMLPLMIVDGRWDEASELAAITHAQGSPLERQMAVTILCQLAAARGDSARAWSMIQELIPRGPYSEPEDALFPYAMETLRLATRLSLESGSLRDARSWLDAHDRWLSWSGAVRGGADSALLRAQLRYHDGQLDEARELAGQAIDRASEPRQPLALVSVHRFLGRLALDADDLAAARQHLDLALELAETCENPYQIALTLIGQIDLHTKAGAGNDVDPLIDRVREIAADLRATPLDEMAQQRATVRPPASPATSELTSRETDVLRLVAEGLTDAEVAERLYISPRTVSQHLRSIYSKLGVSSRTQATRLAVQHELV